MPAVLLEPLFVSNPDQAKWIHDVKNIRKLAEAIVDVIDSAFGPDAVVGLSIGHKFKTSSPGDRGEHLAKAVAAELQTR